MKQVCSMCAHYKGGCTNQNELCVNGSGFIDNSKTVSTKIAMDNESKSLHIIVDGGLISDYEKFGTHLFDVVQREIHNYIEGVKI